MRIPSIDLLINVNYSVRSTDTLFCVKAPRDRASVFPKGAIRSPADFAEIAKLVKPDNYKNRMIISPDMDEHREQIQQFIEVFGKQVIAKLKLG